MPERVVANMFGSPYEFPLEKIDSVETLNEGDHLLIFGALEILRNDMILETTTTVSKVYHEMYAFYCIYGTVKRKIVHFEGEDTIYRVRYQPKGNHAEPRDSAAVNRARSQLGKYIGSSWSGRQFAFWCKHEDMGWDPQVQQVAGCVAGHGMVLGGVAAFQKGAKTAGKVAGAVGVAVEVGCAAHDVHRTLELRRKELIDDKEKAETIATRVVVGTTSTAGSFLGGAACGMAGGPVGAIVGGVAGVIIGTAAGVATSKAAIMAKDEIKRKFKEN